MKNRGNITNIPPIIVLMFGAVCISFAPVFVKLIDSALLGPTVIGLWRVVLGAVILFVWSKLAGNSIKISKRMFIIATIAGFVFALDLFFWHRSIFFCGGGMATILANTQVFTTAILSYFVFKERLSILFFVIAVCAMGGVVLLVGVGSDVEFTRKYLEGIAFGLATGVVYACYIVTIKYAGEKKEKPRTLTLLAWVSLMSGLFLFLISLMEQIPLLPPDFYHWTVLFSMALVAQSIGWWAISSSILKIEGAQSGLILLLQPVLATIWGILFFAEYLTSVQIIGAVITLGAIYIGSAFRTMKK